MTLAERFVQAIEDEGRSALTVTAYRAAAERFLLWVGAHGGWPALDRHLVVAYLRRFRAASTRAWHLAIVRRFCAWMLDEELLKQDPTQKVRRPVLKAGPPKALTEAEDRALERAMERCVAAETHKNRELAVLVLLMRGSGLRIGEVMGRPGGPPGVRLGDLDLERAVVRVIGKGGGTAPAFLHRRTAQLLRKHIKGLPDQRPQAHLFQGPNGQPRGVRWAHRQFGRMLKVAGISRPATPHWLRHTFGTRFLESGGDLRAAQRLLRHRRLSSTLIYADYSTDAALRRQFEEHTGR